MPAKIIGGAVTFKRSFQPEQYGSKGGEVTLNFAVPEGEQIATDEVTSFMDVAEATVMRTLKAKAAPASVDPATATALKENFAAKAEKEEKPATTKATGKPPKPPKVEKETAPKTEEKPAISTGEERKAPDDDDALFAAGGDEEISNKALTDACQAASKKLGEGGGVKIKQLRDKIVGKPGTLIAQLPQNLRRQFLTELEALT